MRAHVCARPRVYTHACVFASVRVSAQVNLDIFNCHQYTPFAHHAQTYKHTRARAHVRACLLAEAVQITALALHFETNVADDGGGNGPVAARSNAWHAWCRYNSLTDV